MNNIQWLGLPESRILSIRNFRKHIESLSFDEAVQLTKENWGYSPRVNLTQFDFSDIHTLPSPWELFGQKFFCVNGMVLGIFYTLALSVHSKIHNIEIGIQEDLISGDSPLLILDSFPLTDKNILFKINKQDLKKQIGE